MVNKQPKGKCLTVKMTKMSLCLCTVNDKNVTLLAKGLRYKQASFWFSYLINNFPHTIFNIVLNYIWTGCQCYPQLSYIIWIFLSFLILSRKTIDRAIFFFLGMCSGRFGLVWFYGISIIVDYSMPNLFFTYIL